MNTNSTNSITLLAYAVKVLLYTTPVLILYLYFLLIYSKAKATGNLHLLTISTALQVGLDANSTNFLNYRTTSTALLFVLIAVFVSTEQSMMVMYTTDSFDYIFTSEFAKFSFVVLNYIATISFLCVLSVTIYSEGYVSHFAPLAIFVTITTIFRFMFLVESNQQSSWKGSREVITKGSIVLIGIGAIFVLLYEKYDVYAYRMIFENLIAVAELLLILLNMWDRIDQSNMLINSHT